MQVTVSIVRPEQLIKLSELICFGSSYLLIHSLLYLTPFFLLYFVSSVPIVRELRVKPDNETQESQQIGVEMETSTAGMKKCTTVSFCQIAPESISVTLLAQAAHELPLPPGVR